MSIHNITKIQTKHEKQNTKRYYKLIPWHVYLVKIPYYEQINATFTFKARPCVLYKNAGDDAVFLPITSNQLPNGKRKSLPNQFQVEVKFQRFGLVKVNQPMTISKEAVIRKKNFGFKMPMNIRRKIIKAWNNLMLWPPIK